MRHRDAAAAVRHDDHRTGQRRHGGVNGLHPAGAVQVLAPHGGDGAGVRQLLRQQGLPMALDVVAQTGDDQNCSGFGHGQDFRGRGFKMQAM